MKNFTSRNDVKNIDEMVTLAKHMKAFPKQYINKLKGKSMALLFMNPSLRTRLSIQKAASNLGLQCFVLNMLQEGWSLEFAEQIEMNGDKPEHIKEAAKMLSIYCDAIAIRSFPKLENKLDDEQETYLNALLKYATVPIVSLESSLLHPLQSFADLITIEETKMKPQPKVVLSWTPHVKAIPHAVANSFLQWMQETDYQLEICHPPGFDLNPQYTKGIPISNSQEDAFQNADFIYAKNWSSYSNYGVIGTNYLSWKINAQKMNLTNNAKFMHCLPLRRNLEVDDSVIDAPYSLIHRQAENRIWATQSVLYKLLNYEN